MCIESKGQTKAEREAAEIARTTEVAKGWAMHYIGKQSGQDKIKIPFHSAHAAAVRATMKYINSESQWQVVEAKITEGALSHHLIVKTK
jgi:hypothetical protein